MTAVKRDIYISINGKEVINSLSGLRKGIRETERDIRNLNRNDKDYNEQLKKHEQALSNLRDEYARARNEISKTPGVLQGIKGELGEVGMGFIKAFTITALIGSFVSGVKSAFDWVVKFDQAQADLAGILETTKAGVMSLTLEAIKLGAKLPFTSTEVSRAQLELAKLGKSITEIINMTPGVLNAAIAMDTDLASAAEFVAGQLNSYAAGSAEATKYADILSNGTNISATSFEYLATSIPKVSKVASVANVSFEKLNATIGVLSDQNIAAETAGTGFRNILLSASKAGVPYEQLLTKVKNSTDQLSTATELFGKENATVAVVLATSTDKIIAQTRALENSSGSAEKLAKEKMNSIEGDLKLFDSALEGFVLSIEKGDGMLAKFTRTVIQMGTGIIGLITPTKNLSDELLDQQLAVNSLTSKITSSNVSNEERLRLLNELQKDYPGFIDNIDLETISNEDLIQKLKEVNSNYRERIRLQLEVEKADKIRDTRDRFTTEALNLESELFDKLIKTANKFDLDIVVDTSNIEKSAKEVMSLLQENGARTGIFSDYKSIENITNRIATNKKIESANNAILEKQLEKINTISEQKGILTEQQLELQKQEKANLDEIYSKALKLGGVAGADFNAEDIKSIQQYIVAKQAQIEVETQVSEGKKKLSEQEQKRLEKLEEQKIKAYDQAEKEIDKILEDSVKKRESQNLKGIQKEIQNIENKYSQELIKFKEHKDRLRDLEIARDSEIEAVKLSKSQEYAQQAFEIEQGIEEEKKIWRFEQQAEQASSEQERMLILLEKTRYIADLEIQSEQEKELAKVEEVENAEELKQAIRDKYALQKAKNDSDFDLAEREIKNKQVDWTKITEEQKFSIIRNSLNMAAEAFNEGSGAWKAAKITDTLMATYQSATNSYNALSLIPFVGPALGTAAAALAVTAGMKNVQKISATKSPEIPSYYYGGHTGVPNSSFGGDNYGTFSGMTHPNEWVMPAFMTQSPRYADTLSWLENERVNGPTNNTPSSGDNSVLAQASMLLATTVSQLNDTLANGIKSDVNIGYKETMKINALNREIEQTQNNSTL